VAAPGHVAAVRAHIIDRLTPQQINQLGDIAQVMIDGLSKAELSA
jgi:hypothetical protein